MVTKKSSPANAIGYDDAKWRAEDDMRTLTRAKEIEADRSRMTAAQKVAAQKIKEMQSVVAKKVTPTVRKK
jgi:hypothetical protein